MLASSPVSAANIVVVKEYESVTTTKSAGDTDDDAHDILPFTRCPLLPIANLTKIRRSLIVCCVRRGKAQ
jgi:hypothetical protein